MQERADSIEGAFDFSEKALFLAQESGDEASTVKAHHTFASINRLIYEKTGLTQLRQKGIAQLKTFEELLSKKAHTHPSVKEWLQEIKAYQSFYADFNKAQLALAQDITRLERGIRQCRTVQQTIFYRTKLIEQLLLLEKQFSSPNAYVNQKLQTAYCQQALAQSRLQNYRAIEINAIEALKRDVDNDRLKALLATTQLMLFKKEVAKETYRTVKDQREIFEVLDDFEKQGVKNAEFNWVRTAYLTEKNGL
jgi:gas vesicle protein